MYVESSVANCNKQHVVSEASVDILMTLLGGDSAGPNRVCSRVLVRSKSTRFLKVALNGLCNTK
jgi:hypothetical protein